MKTVYIFGAEASDIEDVFTHPRNSKTASESSKVSPEYPTEKMNKMNKELDKVTLKEQKDFIRENI